MSDYKHHTGRLTEIIGGGASSVAEGLLKDRGLFNIPDAYIDAVDYIQSELRDEFLVAGDRIFYLRDHEQHYEDGHGKLTRLPDGDLLFDVRYYNGSCCLEEAVEALL